VNKDVFREFVRKHPALVFPAFAIQKKIQDKCLGSSFWKRISKRRKAISEGRYLSVSEIVELMNSESNKVKARREKRGVGLNGTINEKEVIRRLSVESATAASNDVTSPDANSSATHHRRRSSAGKHEELSTYAQAALATAQSGSEMPDKSKRRVSTGGVDDKMETVAPSNRRNMRRTFPAPVEDKNFALMKIESVSSGDFSHDEGDVQKSRPRRNSKGKDLVNMSAPRRTSIGGIAMDDVHARSRRGSGASYVGWEKVESDAKQEPGQQLSKQASARRRGSRGTNDLPPPIESAAKYEELVAQTSKGISPIDMSESSLRRNSRRSSAPLIIPVDSKEFCRNN
jgi:hypothetical protein